jgi:type IV fimbrial biogenesis protein FimT
MAGPNYRSDGFTLIEMMVVVALAAVLVAVAAPSFSDFLSKRRVEGVAAELVTDLQYARSEAVARNANVSVTFGGNCYVIHLSSATAASCTQAGGASVTPSAAMMKAVEIANGAPVSVTRAASLSSFTFEPVLGAASNDVDAVPGVVEVNGTGGRAWKLQLRVSTQGRVKTCSPAGAGHLVGYQTSCSDA